MKVKTITRQDLRSMNREKESDRRHDGLRLSVRRNGRKRRARTSSCRRLPRHVVLGYDSTIPVTLDDMVHHAKAVAASEDELSSSSDLPFAEHITEA